ncbi:3-deoxy-8-phosphooctulonate synthase [Sediminitomix flava]|uniref:3-deoxy-8-phosphooctulonate synthase n=1 Tax=Sediminitomix flava TaxID=379075 RepID=A0A315YWI1_SEDFL|nr:3-deoxy-8-phosphooctulonate synthase [Sediminitomix flava]PWJ33684.1 2-dehydro-3-deoxyphosphooctonate aldolase (KDO 8-P synthase) [Sediminitomix flava]
MTLYEKLQQAPFIISGPCVIEGEDLIMRQAEYLKELMERLGITYIFKASFDKANRTSVDSFRGPGLEEGLRILEKVKTTFDLPLTTDIHEPNQAAPVGEVVDILQIPAFLCRQTDLLLRAGETGKIVNIKKAQFLSGKDMIHPAKKVETTGNKQVMLTERGNSYGNNDLVVDFRNVIDMQEHGYPVVMDVTHSCQKPGGAGGKSGGNSEYAPFFANAAAAVGVRGFFFETHENPAVAKSDGPNMIKLDEFEGVLNRLQKHFV